MDPKSTAVVLIEYHMGDGPAIVSYPIISIA
jgi:hypothetical protein